MNRYFLLIMLLVTLSMNAQGVSAVKGRIVEAGTINPLQNVNIVNLNKVLGTATNNNGEFEIKVSVNDTLHLSYLGYKSIKVRVTNDWVNFATIATIEMTELALALEEVVLNQMKLTGYAELDIQQVPYQQNFRYSISGLTTGYESKPRTAGAITRVLGAIFNPADFLYKMFGKRPNEMHKLRKMKKDDEIRNILSSRFDRQMLTALLQVDRVDLDLLITECNYSKDFVRTANDLQILDALSECYEEYKILSRSRKRL